MNERLNKILERFSGLLINDQNMEVVAIPISLKQADVFTKSLVTRKKGILNKTTIREKSVLFISSKYVPIFNRFVMPDKISNNLTRKFNYIHSYENIESNNLIKTKTQVRGHYGNYMIPHSLCTSKQQFDKIKEILGNPECLLFIKI